MEFEHRRPGVQRCSGTLIDPPWPTLTSSPRRHRHILFATPGHRLSRTRVARRPILSESEDEPEGENRQELVVTGSIDWCGSGDLNPDGIAPTSS